MRQIPGYEDYNIDEDGNVYSNKSGQLKKLKPRKKTTGYLDVVLYKNRKAKTFLVHRLVYISFVENILEDKQIDHVDRDRTNNKLSNLRLVTNQQNGFNTNAKGCSWNKRDKKWQARIVLNYKQIHLGLFNTEEEARAAYIKAKEIYHVFDKNDINEDSK